jgi:hypothetical protein
MAVNYIHGFGIVRTETLENRTMNKLVNVWFWVVAVDDLKSAMTSPVDTDQAIAGTWHTAKAWAWKRRQDGCATLIIPIDPHTLDRVRLS